MHDEEDGDVSRRDEAREVMARVTRLEEKVKRLGNAPPDPETAAELMAMVHQASSLIPDRDVPVAGRLADAAARARQLVDDLGVDSPDFSDATANVRRIGLDVSMAMNILNLPWLTGAADFDPPAKREMGSAFLPVMRLSQELGAALEQGATNVSTIRDLAARLAAASEDLSRNAGSREETWRGQAY